MRWILVSALYELAFVGFLIFSKQICSKTSSFFVIHFLLRFPLAVLDLARARLPLIGSASIIISSILVFWFMALVLGAFRIDNWVMPGIIIGATTLTPTAVTGWTYEVTGSLLGFGLGSVTFPLDWPVCWKNPPASHVVGFVIGSCAGAFVDLGKRRKIREKGIH